MILWQFYDVLCYVKIVKKWKESLGAMDKDNDGTEERYGIVSKGTQSSQYIGSAMALGRAESQVSTIT